MPDGPEKMPVPTLDGSRLRITTLQTVAGSGIELLEYFAPPDGRPMPTGTKAYDLVHRQTRLTSRDADTAAREIRAGRAAFVSPGVVATPDGRLGFGKGLLVRVPDGHVMQVIQK